MMVFRILWYLIALIYFRLYRIIRFFSRDGAQYLVPIVCFAAYLVPLYLYRGGFDPLLADLPLSLLDWFAYPIEARPPIWIAVDIGLLSLGTAYAAFPQTIMSVSQTFVDTFPAPSKPILRRAPLKAKERKLIAEPVGVAVRRKGRPLWVLGNAKHDALTPAVAAIITDKS